MERTEVAIHPDSEGIIVTTNGVLTECSMCNATKKSRRDHKVLISHCDNLWEWSDWENEVNKKIQEGSQDNKSRVLPEELVEKILSMVPFPYVFKARVLSKSWLARLSPISSQDDVEEKRRAILFQKQIRQWSPNWKVFCPVHDFNVRDVNNDPDNDNLLAYDRSSHSWQRLPSLSFLHKALGYGPTRFSQKKSDEGGFILMGGALLLWVDEEELYVSNILTREWKHLPPRPYHLGTYRSRLSRLIRDVSFHHTFETYKVIVWSIGPPSHMQDQFPECDDFIQIYDSATASWSHVMATTSIDTYCFDAVGGVFYFVEYDYSSFSLIVKCLNINEEILVKEPVIMAEVDLRGRRFLEAHPVICSTNLLIVIVYLYNGPHLVVKIDLGKKELLGVSDQGFPNYPKTEGLDPISDGDYIFAKVETDGSGVFAYNIHADQWELLPYCMESDHHKIWEGSVKHYWYPGWHEPYWHSFQPGLNPFAAV